MEVPDLDRYLLIENSEVVVYRLFDSKFDAVQDAQLQCDAAVRDHKDLEIEVVRLDSIASFGVKRHVTMQRTEHAKAE